MISDNSVPLYSLFARSSIQVGVESTAVYEGMSFGLSTYIWDIPMAGNLKKLADTGYAKLFSNSGELLELISRNDGSTDYNVEDFWKPDALKNIVSGIKKVVEE